MSTTSWLNWIIVFSYLKNISSIFLCCSHCIGFNTVLSLICTVNVFSVLLLSQDTLQSNKSSADLQVCPHLGCKHSRYDLVQATPHRTDTEWEQWSVVIVGGTRKGETRCVGCLRHTHCAPDTKTRDLITVREQKAYVSASQIKITI